MADQTNTQPQDENHLIAERREKLAAWRASGRAFPNDFSRENTAGKLDELYGEKEADVWRPPRSRSRWPAASC